MHPFFKFIILQIDEVTDQGECEVVENKKARLPHTTSELHLLSSEKLNLSRAQAMRRRNAIWQCTLRVHAI